MSKDTIRREIYTPLAGLRLREENGEPTREIEGYAIRFNEPSAIMGTHNGMPVVEVIDPEAVTRELLDRSDILMTLFHDRGLILARSRGGEGTLSYEIDAEGVRFRFTAPDTVDGDKAVALVRTGDLSGCSFAFSTRYRDRDHVEVTTESGSDGKKRMVCRVRRMTGIYDFTLTPDPAYPSTSVEMRDALSAIGEREEVKEGATEPEDDPAAIAPVHVRRMTRELKSQNI